jgi:hypothetical protein
MVTSIHLEQDAKSHTTRKFSRSTMVLLVARSGRVCVWIVEALHIL